MYIKPVNTKKRNNKGQEAIEWWFIVTCISFVVMFSLITWGKQMNEMSNTLNNTLNNVNTGI